MKMKKLVATLLVFLMVFAVTAQAEEANENVFTFRNGVTFNMFEQEFPQLL